MASSKTKYVPMWLRSVLMVCAWLSMVIILRWTMSWTDRTGFTICVVFWVLFAVVDVAAYSRAKSPERRDCVGTWPGSGLLALWWFGAGDDKGER